MAQHLCADIMRAIDATERSPTGRHLIKRPRLTRLLDEAPARVILLLAPAGYGKTTLVREWGERRGRQLAWCQLDHGSDDIAQLASGIAGAISELAPNAVHRITERLSVRDGPAPNEQTFGRLLAKDLHTWNPNWWLAIDDYHLASSSAACELLVEQLIAETSVNFIIASRKRPAWATARRSLYGEVFVIGQNTLAMSAAEARKVLKNRNPEDVPALLRLADGWPAVIGLAAVTSAIERPDDDFVGTLYDFFAEEFVRAVPDSLKRPLEVVTLLGSVDYDLGTALWGSDGQPILHRLADLGLLTSQSDGAFRMHPLLRDFLNRKSGKLDTNGRASAAYELGRLLLSRERWVEVFDLVERFSSTRLLHELISVAGQPMLRQGRVETLRRWVSFARSNGVTSTLLDVTEAENAFRDGALTEAEDLFERAFQKMGADDRHASYVLYRLGRCAYFREDPARALKYHVEAKACARREIDHVQALWGQLQAMVELDEDPSVLRTEFNRFRTGDLDARLRYANAQFTIARRMGGVGETLESCRRLIEQVPLVDDPMLRSSVLNGYAHTLVLGAFYGLALQRTAEAIREIEEYDLAFAFPHALLTRAAALGGLRRFQEAARAIDEAEAAATRIEDSYSRANVAALRGRLYIGQRSYEAALDALDVCTSDIVSRPLLGEIFATRALAHACSGNAPGALEDAARAERTTSSVEARCLAHWAKAIATPSGGPAIHNAWDVACRTGNFDSFVYAYRGKQSLLASLGETGERIRAEIFRRAHDLTIARASGLQRSVTSGLALSAREDEVLDLVAEGLTNRLIAQALFISEVTVKVHIRHIFEKLGTRSRTEAAAIRLRATQAESIRTAGG